jgi:hypothetical protein
MRIINALNKSGYNLSKSDFVSFYYYKSYINADLHKYYRVNPRNGGILEEAND